MIQILPESTDNARGYRFSGKLKAEDYKQFLPDLEHWLGQHDHPRLLVWFHNFHGWDMKAAWEDLKFDIHHRNDCERIAMVGERKLDKWMARLTEPFTQSEVRYFDADQLEDAWDWIHN